MDEPALMSILRRLGITPTTRSSRKGWVDFRCPFPHIRADGSVHFDRSASAGAKIEVRGVSAWHCAACKRHGRITALIRGLARQRNQDLQPLIEFAQRADMDSELALIQEDFERDSTPAQPAPLVEEAYEGFYEDANASPEATAYLLARGISGETAKALGLLWDPEQRRVLFPVRDEQGWLYGWTGRAVDHETQPKIKDYQGLPKRHLILGRERWRRDRPVIVVEGLFAYAHLVEIGVEEFANVGALLGSEMTPEKAAILRSFDETTCLLLDNDPAGDAGIFGPLTEDGEREASRGAVALLREYVPVLVPAWPEGKDDPDQLTVTEVRAMLTTTAVWNNY
jgi:hypothetical protein